MPITKKCSRCHETYSSPRRSRFGQICPWCEDSMIMAERELSFQCGIRPLNELDIIEFNKYWLVKDAINMKAGIGR